jgi:hypothetical protein
MLLTQLEEDSGAQNEKDEEPEFLLLTLILLFTSSVFWGFCFLTCKL